jgi:hypothetical protein
MHVHSETPTQDDMQGLIDKLVDFDATLTPAQRSVFRSRILTTMPDSDEVEGHNWEMRWEAGLLSVLRVSALIRGARASELSLNQIVNQMAPRLIAKLARRLAQVY